MSIGNQVPLAERMRPQSLDDFVGQEHLVGKGKPIRRMIENKKVISMVLWGPPGTGKSHIATALTVAAIQAGYTALYRSAFDLAQDMAEAEATGTRRDLVDNLCKVDLLVLEDLGMKRLPPTAAEDLLEIVVRRYEKGSIIMTTNRPLEDWGQVLGDTAAAGAILDRFLHHAEVIRLQGRSYRMYNRRELLSKQPEEVLTGQTK